MKNFEKYKRQYYLPPNSENRWAKKDYIDKPPIWCSVDLRDGNQALLVPMNLDEKIEFFKMLVNIGFKQIEVGFPAASETEYMFLRQLIEKNLINDDITVQVLTQAREHIITKTFEALKGAKKAIVHVYNSTSVAQREQVFHKNKEQIIKIATDGIKLVKKLEKDTDTEIIYEYSPESFTGTEPEFALEICNRVLDIIEPTKDKKAIINLPVTVSHSLPHVYAAQVEYINDNLKYRDCVDLSLHPHNDRGTAVADCELGLLAGADRVEGTLFGNGERTGNVDIITLALNMYSQGVDPGLNFENLPQICDNYERITKRLVYDRHPYCGQLVFAAFSGSHQDAIAKSMKYRREHDCRQWTVPYLPIDPKDVGRAYEDDVIRINSQSGKSGIGYILEQRFGYTLPKNMQQEFGYYVKDYSDHNHKELAPKEVLELFKERYIDVDGPLKLIDCHFRNNNPIFYADIKVEFKGAVKELTSSGNGRLDAVSNAIKDNTGIDFTIEEYTEHALQKGSNSQAVAYVSIKSDNQIVWGVGIHDDIMFASVDALFAAINRTHKL